MPLKFSSLCELLEDLDRCRYQQRSTTWKQVRPDHRLVKDWYSRYNDKIDRHGPAAVAFLSALLPERRPDRTHNLQEKRLSHIFGNALGLGTARLRDLLSWQQTHGQDFPTCVQRVMSDCEFDPPATGKEVTLEEIDDALTLIAANTISSAPIIKARANVQAPVDILKHIIRRLRSHEGKWLVRMIQKSYSPLEVPEYAVLHGFHFMLPKLLEIQNCFKSAIETLSTPGMSNFQMLPLEDEAKFVALMAQHISPQLGIMVRRQPFCKARSIKHCVNMATSRIMSIERKHDGEYCQVHIDISKGRECIQIFSKNGRDSTEDRLALQSAIKAGLKLGLPDCKIKSRAILEGELLVYCSIQKAILPFYHIRKHVRHGGRRIGTEMDSPKKSSESLMIVFYDILMLDKKILLVEPHKKRRAHLKGVVTPIVGYAEIVERAMIDFGSREAPEILRTAFGSAIRKRWEGFVLKGLEDPYFSWQASSRSIKLKKDYIAGLGDSADLCIVGGRCDPRIRNGLGLGRLSWTNFYVAAVINKDEVRRHDVRPAFRILDCLGPGSLSKDDIMTLNSEGKFLEQDYVAESTFMVIQHPRTDIPLPTHIFTRPIVVEVMGAGYERPQSANFWMLRFPRRVGSKIKLHRDRDIADTVSFDELQGMAEESMKHPENQSSQEEQEWVARLMAADPRSAYQIDKSQSTSPAKTLRSDTTVSLTPAGGRHSGSQRSPVIVRVDSEEVTIGELFGTRTESCPNLTTPSRRSGSTTTPSGSSNSRISKRDFAAMQDSPSPGAIQRVQRTVMEGAITRSQAKHLSQLSNAQNSRSSKTVRSPHTGKSTAVKSITSFRDARSSAVNMVSIGPPPVTTVVPRKSYPPELLPTLSSTDLARRSEQENPAKPTPQPHLVQSITHETGSRSISPANNHPFFPHNTLIWISPMEELKEVNTQLVLESSRLHNDTYTRSVDKFVKHFVNQSTLPANKRKQHIALLNAASPKTAVSHLRTLSKKITEHENHITTTNAGTNLSIQVYYVNVLNTSLQAPTKTGTLETTPSDVIDQYALIGTLVAELEDEHSTHRNMKSRMEWNIHVDARDTHTKPHRSGE